MIPALEGTAFQAIVLGLVAFTAYRAGCALLPESADALDRIFVAGMVGIIGWVALLQALGLVGVLWLPVVLVCLVALASLSLRLVRPRLSPRRPWAGEAWSAIAWSAPFAALALVVVLSAAPGLNSYDTLHYQIPNAAHILDGGSIRSLPFALPGEGTGAGPGNGSLLLLSVMLPFHTAALTGLVNLLCAAMIVVVTAELGRALGRSAWAGAIAGLMLISTVAFFVTQMRSALDNSVALLGLLSAMGFGLWFASRGEHRWLFLAGAGLGLAAGAKAAYLLPAAVVGIAVLWTTRGWRCPRALAIFVVAILGLSVAWYLRAWVITGDPLFPEPVQLGPWSVFSGLSAAASATRSYEQTLLDAVLGRGGTSLKVWLGYVFVNFGPVVAAPLLSLVVMARSRGGVRLVAAVAVGCALAYLVTPFSGSTDPNQVNAAVRFLMPACAFGLVALSSVAADRWLRLLGAVTLGTDTALLLIGQVRYGILDPELLAVAGAVTVLVLVAVRWPRQLSTLVRPASVRGGMGVLVAAAAVVAVLHLQAAPDPSPAEQALLTADNERLPVLVMDVGDVAALLGPDLRGNIVAAGTGPAGAEQPIHSIPDLNRRIAALHPALVVIGHLDAFDTIPAGWTPGPGWRNLGTVDGAAVYWT